MNAMAPVIEVDSVVTRFGAQTVHDGVTFSVARGQVAAMIGSSGSGKSVLVREIIGLLRPTAGTVRLLGTDVWTASAGELAALRHRFGMMFQDGALFSSLTVAQNVARPLLEHAAVPPDLLRPLVRLRITLAGLPIDAATKMPSELSGGMRKRAGFARALVLEPELLLFDEPDSGLDPVRTALLCDLIKQIQRKYQSTGVVISHDIKSCFNIGDHIILLHGGKVVDQGSKEELQQSTKPFTQQFIKGAVEGPLGME